MEPIKLQSARLPRALGELAHSNQLLKFSAFVAYCLSFLTLVLLFLQASKPPLVLTLSPDGTPLERVAPPKPEDEIVRAVRAYTELRYHWEPKTVAQRLSEAEAFISPTSRKAYESTTTNISKFAVEKGVLQRIYPTEIKVDLEAKPTSWFVQTLS